MLGEAATGRLPAGYRRGRYGGALHLRYSILGPLAVTGPGGPVRLGGPRQRSLLAALLLQANRVVSIDRLAEQLYDDAPPVTAVSQIHRQVSELRQALGAAGSVETVAPGYRLLVAPDALDLERFERLTLGATSALARGDAAQAAGQLREALGLWRGEPLADLAVEAFAAPAIARLQELRLAALEARIEADLRLGDAAALVGELTALVAEHPLRERLHAHRMLALYRAGRQPEALEAYGTLRRALVDAFGLEPTPALQELERRILRHDAALDGAAASPRSERRSILVAARAAPALDVLLTLAEPLAAAPGRELVVVQLVRDADEVAPAASELAARRRALSSPARAAAFSSVDLAADVLRLEHAHEVDLVLLAVGETLDGARLPAAVERLLTAAGADVGVLATAGRAPRGTGVVVPFAGGAHDWAALETAAWLALTTGQELRLVGTRAERGGGRPDSSRLLADASLALQRVVGVDATPRLVAPGVDALLAAVAGAGAVLAGLSPRWREDGLGTVRRALARNVTAPLLFVHRGLRPGGLAPASATTRFSWTVER